MHPKLYKHVRFYIYRVIIHSIIYTIEEQEYFRNEVHFKEMQLSSILFFKFKNNVVKVQIQNIVVGV